MMVCLTSHFVQIALSQIPRCNVRVHPTLVVRVRSLSSQHASIDVLCQDAVPGVATLKALPRLSTMFTGRQDILERLARCLNPSISSVSLKIQRIFVLYGLGGTGKTQIMAKFVDEFGDQYDIDPFNWHQASHSNDPHPHLGSGVPTLSTLAPLTPSSRA